MRYDWRADCTLHHGPYEETLALCAEQGGADLIAFSPPYADARTYGMDCHWTHEDYQRLGDHVWSALRPGGWALVNVSAPVREWTGDGRGTERGLHAYRLLLDWHDRIGFRVPDVLVFGRQGMPGENKGRFANSHEPLCWLQRPGATIFERSRLDAPARSGVFAGGIITGSHSDGSTRPDRTSGRNATLGVRMRGSIWEYRQCGNGMSGAPDIEAQRHPARWPYRLARDIILCFSNPGDLVCDPFLGAGTTGAAALDYRRRFIGGDLGARQDTPTNRERGLDTAPWVEIAARVYDERYKAGRPSVPAYPYMPKGWLPDDAAPEEKTMQQGDLPLFWGER